MATPSVIRNKKLNVDIYTKPYIDATYSPSTDVVLKTDLGVTVAELNSDSVLKDAQIPMIPKTKGGFGIDVSSIITGTNADKVLGINNSGNIIAVEVSSGSGNESYIQSADPSDKIEYSKVETTVTSGQAVNNGYIDFILKGGTVDNYVSHISRYTIESGYDPLDTTTFKPILVLNQNPTNRRVTIRGVKTPNQSSDAVPKDYLETVLSGYFPTTPQKLSEVMYYSLSITVPGTEDEPGDIVYSWREIDRGDGDEPEPTPAYTTHHDELEHLAYPNQHPITAIIGLNDSLQNILTLLSGKATSAQGAKADTAVQPTDLTPITNNILNLQTRTADIENNKVNLILTPSSVQYPTTNAVIQYVLQQIEGTGIIVVEELPATGSSTAIYFVGPDSFGNYERYIWDNVNSQWVLLGSTEIDLTRYMRRDEIITISEDW